MTVEDKGQHTMSSTPTGTATHDSRPIAVMTLMVRDEIDIIGDWLDYHLAQGLRRILVTDNGSTDGTYELLQKYADADLIDLDTYAEHDKQQARVVTQMAHEAYRRYRADWVLNSDADEFWLTGSGDPLITELAKLPREGKSFPVPVHNLYGRALESGFRFEDAVWRDERSDDALARVGIHSHPTQNLIHPGSDEVQVSQGNHFTDQPQADALPDDVQIDVVHFQTRSWEQYRTRVQVTGEGYERSPHLHPSPRHHTMRDYRWLHADALRPFFAARHPQGDSPEGFVRDTRLSDRLPQPSELRANVPARQPVPFKEQDAALMQYDATHATVLALEEERVKELTNTIEQAQQASADAEALQHHNTLQHERIEQLEARVAALNNHVELLESRVAQERDQIDKHLKRITEHENELELLRNRKIVKATDAVATRVKSLKTRFLP